METDSNRLADADLRAAILGGLAAMGELETRFRLPLERYLAALCDRGDGRSLERAVEIASQVVADCFVKSPSLLERWKGEGTLEAFLRSVAVYRLKSWWRSRDHAATEVNSESRDLRDAADETEVSDCEEIGIAADALRKGVKAACERCPDGVVFMRLKGLHGVDQRVISACWGHHEAQTSRRIREAMEIIREVAMASAAEKGCGLSLDGLREAQRIHPGILMGPGVGNETPVRDDLLREVAVGGACKKALDEVVRMLIGDPEGLARFARLLNGSREGEPKLARDGQFEGMGERMADCVRRTLATIHPRDAAALISPLMGTCFSDMLAHVGADGGTLWWLSPGRDSLEAVFNPREPEIVGKRQPLVSGIVSLVLGTGEAVVIADATKHARHSPAIDVLLGRITRSMVAVPFVVAGGTVGVMSVVRWSRQAEFAVSDLAIIHHHAEVIGNLLGTEITRRILA